MREARARERTRPTKRPYVKPEIMNVPLRPEEAVLGNCKSAASVGSLQATCNSPSNCLSLGS